MLTAVAEIVKRKPNPPTQARFLAKVSNRSSERPGLAPGSNAQFSQNPCSPFIGRPQLGQSASLDSPVSLAAGSPLRNSFQRSTKWWAALFRAGLCRHWASNPWPSTSSRAEAPPFSLVCKLISGESCHALLAVSGPLAAAGGERGAGSGDEDPRSVLPAPCSLLRAPCSLLSLSARLMSRLSVRRINPCENLSWRSRSGSNHANRISLPCSADSAFARSRGGSSWRISGISGERTDTKALDQKAGSGWPTSWGYGCEGAVDCNIGA